MADRLPTWQEGPVVLEDFQDQTDYIKASTPRDGPGIKVQRTPNGSIISAEGESRNRAYRVIIPAGGIASNTNTNVYYYGASHTNSGQQINVWNRLEVSVGDVNAKTGYAVWIDVEGEYQVVQEVCGISA